MVLAKLDQNFGKISKCEALVSRLARVRSLPDEHELYPEPIFRSVSDARDVATRNLSPTNNLVEGVFEGIAAGLCEMSDTLVVF